MSLVEGRSPRGVVSLVEGRSLRGVVSLRDVEGCEGCDLEECDPLMATITRGSKETMPGLHASPSSDLFSVSFTG